MVADSERDANMLYAVGMFVPDPFIYLHTTGRPLIVMSDLEIDRARAQAPHCRVASLVQYQQKLRAQGIVRPGLAHVVRHILREKGIRRVTVPDNFPLGLATDLEKLGIPVKARPGNFFPEREIKSAAEVRKISAALMMAEVGMAEAMQVLRTANAVWFDGGRQWNIVDSYMNTLTYREFHKVLSLLGGKPSKDDDRTTPCLLVASDDA